MLVLMLCFKYAIDVLIFLTGVSLFVFFHEQAHKEIYLLAEAAPVFYHKSLVFDYKPTRPLQELNSTLYLQGWCEIIGYHILGTLFFLLGALLVFVY